jgi:hypothetical protein
MIYPDDPIGNGISLTEQQIKELNSEINDLLDTYLRFKCVCLKLTEIKHGFITLEVTYPDRLPDSSRDQNYILMVVAYVLGKPVLDKIFSLMVIEYECDSRTGYFEFDYYTQEEKNKRVEDAMFSTINRLKIRDHIMDRNDLINLYK